MLSYTLLSFRFQNLALLPYVPANSTSSIFQLLNKSLTISSSLCVFNFLFPSFPSLRFSYALYYRIEWFSASSVNWVALPLQIHNRVVRRWGQQASIAIVTCLTPAGLLITAEPSWSAAQSRVAAISNQCVIRLTFVAPLSYQRQPRADNHLAHDAAPANYYLMRAMWSLAGPPLVSNKSTHAYGAWRTSGRHCFLSRLFGLLLLILERFFSTVSALVPKHACKKIIISFFVSTFWFLAFAFAFAKFMRRLVWQFLGISTRSIWTGWLHIFMVVGIACILFRCWRAATPHARCVMYRFRPRCVAPTAYAIAALISQNHRRR